MVPNTRAPCSIIRESVIRKPVFFPALCFTIVNIGSFTGVIKLLLCSVTRDWRVLYIFASVSSLIPTMPLVGKGQIFKWQDESLAPQN